MAMGSCKAYHFYTIAIITLGIAIWLPFGAGQLLLAFDPHFYDPDTYRLYPYYRYFDPQLFPSDDAVPYFQSLLEPYGYWLLHVAWAHWLDPALFHRLLLPVLWLSCVPAVWLCGKALGGTLNAHVTLLIFACSSVFVFRIMGGMSHSFGFPLSWWVATSLLRGKPAALAGITLASALLYPIITPIAGCSLALWLLFLGKQAMGSSAMFHWALRKKIGFLGILGTACIALVWPLLPAHEMADYGRLLSYSEDNVVFRELSNPRILIPPLLYVMITYSLQHGVRIGVEHGQLLTLVILVLMLLSILFHDPRDGRPGRIKPFLYAAGLIFCISLFINFDNAYRFGVYTAPVLLTLYVPLALRRLCRGLLPRRCRHAAFITLALAYSFCLAKVDPPVSGYLLHLGDAQLRALDYIRTLPKDSMLAGWPGDRSGKVIESVPYVAQRQALVTWAGHVLLHERYVLTMREKMNAVVDAYLAQTLGPIQTLRDQFQVDYLVVNEADFKGDKAPTYISPFNERAKDLWESNPAQFFAVLKLAKTISVYDQDGIYILDLRRLP